MDFPVNADVVQAINNPHAVEWQKFGSQSKIVLTLQKMKTTASAQFYVKAQFCKPNILTDCIAKSFRSANFDMSKVGGTILDIQFSTFSSADWEELASLDADSPVIKIQLMKVTSVFEWRPDLLQAQYLYDLSELMSKQQSELIKDPSIRFELLLQN